MIFARILALMLLGVLGIYLFVSAPEPLPERASLARPGEKRLAIERVFDAINVVNHEARRIYTARIVGPGQKSGLAFNENWQQAHEQAGPLPALFLRLVSSELTKKPEMLGLFLGSDQPINSSNLFSGEQMTRFRQMKIDGVPQSFVTAEGQQVAMYPDVASAQLCVSCHNDHDTSPKRDWKLDEIMGATTWIYPASEVSVHEANALIANVYAAVESAWRIYLLKTTKFSAPPPVGAYWPEAGMRALPDAATFMAEVYQASAPEVMRILNGHFTDQLGTGT